MENSKYARASYGESHTSNAHKRLFRTNAGGPGAAKHFATMNMLGIAKPPFNLPCSNQMSKANTSILL